MWLEQCMAIVFVGDNLYLVDKGMFFSTQVNLYEFSSINWMLKCVKFDSVIRLALASFIFRWVNCLFRTFFAFSF